MLRSYKRNITSTHDISSDFQSAPQKKSSGMQMGNFVPQ